MNFDYYDFEPEIFAGIWAGVMITLMLAIIPTIFYLLTLQRTLAAVKPENRSMAPGQVWMILIPAFGIVWMFFVVERIGTSVRKEFDDLGITHPEAKPAYGVGLTMAILMACCAVPFVNFLAGPAALVLWIIYWVKVAGLKRMIEEQAGQNLPPAS